MYQACALFQPPDFRIVSDKSKNMKLISAITAFALTSACIPVSAELNPIDELIYRYAFNFGWLAGACTFYAAGALCKPDLMFAFERIEEHKSLSPEIKEQIFRDIHETKGAPECATALRQFESSKE